MVQGCWASRGPTKCTDIGRCVCQPGYCSGAEGRCYPGRYKLLLENFTIRNYRWKDKYMFASHGSELGFSYPLRVSSDSTSLPTRFRLYQMPDGALLLYSMAYPGYAAHVEVDKDNMELDHVNTAKHDMFSSTISGDVPTVSGEQSRFFKVSLLDIRVSGLLSSNPQAGAPTLQVFRPPGGDAKLKSTGGAVMLGSHKFSHRYMYVPGMSYGVDMYYDDPGDGALWVFDPPLPADVPLKDFVGEACDIACTGPGSFQLRTFQLVWLLLAALLLYAFFCGSFMK